MTELEMTELKVTELKMIELKMIELAPGTPRPHMRFPTGLS